jgi:hypothetical protein
MEFVVPDVLTSAPKSPTKSAPDFFGSPPLIAGEDADHYNELLARVCAAVQPADIIEEMWVRDVVGLQWEIQRLRRLTASLLLAKTHDGLRKVLFPICHSRPHTIKPISMKYLGLKGASELTNDWIAGAPDAVQTVQVLLRHAGLSMDAVMAQTLADSVHEIEMIECLVTGKIACRDSVLREIDRRRAIFAEKLRLAAQQGEQDDLKLIASHDSGGAR